MACPLADYSESGPQRRSSWDTSSTRACATKWRGTGEWEEGECSDLGSQVPELRLGLSDLDPLQPGLRGLRGLAMGG